MKILALDLASATGFALGDGGAISAHGTFKLPSTGPDIGSFLADFREWLTGRVVEWEPELIAFEMPILPDTTAIHTLRKLYSLAGMTELIARDHDTPVEESNLSDIRDHFIGATRAPRAISCTPGCKTKGCNRCRTARRQWLKDRTIAACKDRGFRPQDDNAADAIALYSFVLSIVAPGVELVSHETAEAA